MNISYLSCRMKPYARAIRLFVCAFLLLLAVGVQAHATTNPNDPSVLISGHLENLGIGWQNIAGRLISIGCVVGSIYCAFQGNPQMSIMCGIAAGICYGGPWVLTMIRSAF